MTIFDLPRNFLKDQNPEFPHKKVLIFMQKLVVDIVIIVSAIFSNIDQLMLMRHLKISLRFADDNI